MNVSHPIRSPSTDENVPSLHEKPTIPALTQRPVLGQIDQVRSGDGDNASTEVFDSGHTCFIRRSERSEIIMHERVDLESRGSGVDRVQAQIHTFSGISRSLKQFLESYVEPMSIRASKLRQFRTIFGDLTVWLGPIMVQRWTSTQDPFYEISAPSDGFGLAVLLPFPYTRFHRAAFTLLFTRSRKLNLTSLSVRCNLSFPTVVPKDASIMRFARTNNLEAMRHLFQTGQAAASDTTPTGKCLLHVSFANPSHHQLC